jgi:dienelactone hydrolase
MRTMFAVPALTLGLLFGSALAQADATGSKALDAEHVVITEPVKGSDIPVRLMYVETMDGLYAPIGLRKPPGDGPFPIVLFASGNGGGGMAYIEDVTQNQSWTQEQFLKAGYAVAWLRYRTEIELGYNKGGPLIKTGRMHREVFNRGLLEYEDVISIIDYVKSLPYIDGGRVGYMGSSHGGEMAFKIATEYNGLRAAIASEPANHEYLALKPDETAPMDADTGIRNIEHMMMRETDKVRSRIDLPLARQRIGSIQTPIFVIGRDSDELQGIFKVSYDLLRESGKTTQWKTYDHSVHGFVYVKRGADGEYRPDSIQAQAVNDAIAWFDRFMKGNDAPQPPVGGVEGVDYSDRFYND